MTFIPNAAHLHLFAEQIVSPPATDVSAIGINSTFRLMRISPI